MKINSVYISAFGKFQDKRFDFDDGLNLIYGENEDGKTTLMTFIRMMFYGTTGKSTDELYKNPRKKYAPRNDKPMAGSIDFESNGKKYRIERIFKSSNATDKIAVIDIGSGERENFTGKEDLGKRFLGLSIDAANRSVFLSEHGAALKSGSADGELNARLSNLAGTGSEETSAEEILLRLEKAKNILITKTGRGGKIAKDTEELNQLKKELEKTRRIEQDRKECDLRLENERARLLSIQNEIGRLTAHIQAAEGGKRYTKLKEYYETATSVDLVNKKLLGANGEIITVPLLSDAETKLNEYKVLSENVAPLKEKAESLEIQVAKLKEELNIEESSDKINKEIELKKSQLNSCEKDVNRLEQEVNKTSREVLAAEIQKPKIRPLFPILTVIFAALTIAAYFFTQFKNISVILCAIIVILGLVLTLVFRKKPQANLKELKLNEQALKTQLEQKQKESDTLNHFINELITKEALAKQKEVAASENFTEKFEEYKKVSEELNTLKIRLLAIEEFLSAFKNSKEQDFSVKGMEIILYSHKTNLQKKENFEVKLAILKKDLDGISVEQAEKELSVIPEGAISVGDLDELNERLIFKKKEYETLQQTIADDTASARNDFRFIKHPTELEHQIEETERLISKECYFSESVDIAIDTLNDAFAKVRETFGSALSQRAGEIFSSLTNGKYSSVNISKSFNISVEEKDIFGSQDWQSLSDGTIDQAYFALRLTVSEFLSGDGEKLPLILDDPFDRYDDTRAEKALQFLKDYSKENQALMFTCHKSFTEKHPFITLK